MATYQNPNQDGVSIEASKEAQVQGGGIDITYQIGRDKPSDVLTGLIVAVVLAAMTYKAVLTPPGGIWQEDGPTTNGIKQVAGVSVLATQSKLNFIISMIFNTMGFFSFMNILDDLSETFTHQLKLRFALLAICFTYGICVSIITPSEFRAASTTCIFLITIGIVAVIRTRREKMRAR